MKLSVTYLVTIMKYGYPPKPGDDFKSLESLRKMGFHYLEMEGLGREHAAAIRTHVKEYQQALAANDIHIHNFCIVDPDLVSLEKEKRLAAYEHFKEMVEVGCALGTETFHLASYAPPVEYLGRAPYQLDGEDYTYGTSTRIHIPEGFCWQSVWEALVESCRFCAEYVGRMGHTIIMEPRVGETICSADSLLRLIADVGCPTFKANFDTGHFSAQREDVCLALKKLEGQYANIHIADNDPVNADHLPIGEGCIDWNEFFRILVAQGYDGYLGIDLGAKNEEELIRGLLKSRDNAAAAAKAAGAQLSW